MRKINPPQRDVTLLKASPLRVRTFKAFDSFHELREDYEADIRAMTPSGRIAAMDKLRRDYFRVKGLPVTDRVERTLEITDNGKRYHR